LSRIKIKNTKNYIKVNNIFCIGRNYVDHIKELNSGDIPVTPIVFLKPNSAIISAGKKIKIPEYQGKAISDNMHYEAELVIVISKDGNDIPEEIAEDYILGFAIGLDMTLRDIQTEAKKKGNPWSVSKGFYCSAPISEIILKNKNFDPMNTEIKLIHNTIEKQHSNTNLMIFNIYKLISYISSIFSLRKGDLIFTGTPAGVGKVNSGDKMTAILGNFLKLEIEVF